MPAGIGRRSGGWSSGTLLQDWMAGMDGFAGDARCAARAACAGRDGMGSFLEGVDAFLTHRLTGPQISMAVTDVRLDSSASMGCCPSDRAVSEYGAACRAIMSDWRASERAAGDAVRLMGFEWALSRGVRLADLADERLLSCLVLIEIDSGDERDRLRLVFHSVNRVRLRDLRALCA